VGEPRERRIGMVNASHQEVRFVGAACVLGKGWRCAPCGFACWRAMEIKRYNNKNCGSCWNVDVDACAMLGAASVW
jgi:hypothetical protein